MALSVVAPFSEAFNAEPIAAKRWEFSGIMVCSASSLSVRTKAALS